MHSYIGVLVAPIISLNNGLFPGKNFFGHVTWLLGIPDNHFGWRHSGYQHTRGLINFITITIFKPLGRIKEIVCFASARAFNFLSAGGKNTHFLFCK